MLVVILLTILALVLPVVILRPFSGQQRLLVLAIVVVHVATMFVLHYHLVRTTGLPIVIDVHDDERVYYDSTAHFKDWPPFSVTRRAAIDATEGSKHFGYQYLLGTLWTITSDPMLAMRLLKTLLFFASLSCLARVWRKDYGSRLAMWGVAFMAIVCTPVFYFNYRNLKDSLILSLFMFTMALLDTLLRPRKDQLHPRSTGKTVFGWFVLLILLYVISTFRLYTSAIVVIAVVMHAIMNSRMDLKARVSLTVILAVIVLIAFGSGTVATIMELYEEKVGARGILDVLSVRGLLQAFLSPIPWGVLVEVEPFHVPFYSIYWLLLPYALYSMVRHFWTNINWHLFVYLMILYVVGGAIGDPPRKRLIVYPILVTWVLAHLAYKRLARSPQAECEIEDPYADYEHGQEYALMASGKDFVSGTDSQ